MRKVKKEHLPRFVCYDNGGETYDRYTVIPRDRAFDSLVVRRRVGRPLRMCLGMSEGPTEPLGFSQWTHGQAGPHLGRKLPFSALPKTIQRHIIARCRD